MKWFGWMCVLLLPLWPSAAAAETIKVAVASNFANTMKALVAEFEKASDHKVTLSFASTGKLYAQILNGAPYHAFFSADQATIEKLEHHNKALRESRFTYAIGILVLWSAQEDLAQSPLQALTNGAFNKLALANPKLAPYGAAAVETLEQLDLKAVTQRHWVQGENIAQAFQFTATQNADLGFAALSQIVDYIDIEQRVYWQVPDNLYRPIRQDAQILTKGTDSPATRQLMAFIRSDTAKSIIQTHGYKIPDDP